MSTLELWFGDWRAPLLRWAAAGGRVALILAGAWLLVRLARAAILRMERMVEDDDDTTLSEREKRARTLGSILRKAVAWTAYGAAGIMALDELGVPVAPIVTAAGIGGLALSFGAQNLVRDVISGFFILLENQLHVGDVVSIDGTSGVVEALNLRTIVLRDLAGTVHSIPNGAVTKISNMTRDWSRYVLDIGVAYKEDVDRVIALLRQVGDEVAADPAYSRYILKPLEILGVDAFGPSEVTIKAFITTVPLKQWEVGRELRRRIKNAFDRHGIEIPFPHVTLYWGEASRPMEMRLAQDGQPCADRPRKPRERQARGEDSAAG